MSTKIKLTLDGEILEVELYHNPDLEFEIHNKDLAFDTAAHEFGYPATAAMHFMGSMKENPVTFLLGYLEDTDTAEEIEACRLLDFFMLDVAEHTIRIYEDVAEDGYLGAAIKQTRAALKAEDEEHPARGGLKNLLKNIRNRERAARRLTQAPARAADAAIDALTFVIQPIGDIGDIGQVASGVAFSSAIAVGKEEPESDDISTWPRTSFKENIWQARHLVHMIEVMQNGGDFRELRTL